MGSYVSKSVVPQEFLEDVKSSQVVSYAKEHPWVVAGSLAVGYLLWDWFGWVLGPKLPPGPLGLPLIGNLHQVSPFMAADFKRLGETYGEIFMLRLCGRPIIVLNSYDVIKEAFVKRGTEFADRPQDSGIVKLLETKDEFFSRDYSPEWQANKKFAMKALRSFGFGTKALEERIQTEIDKICDAIVGQNGAPMEITPLVQKGASNVIHSILFNFQLTLDDPEVEDAVKRSTDVLYAFIEASSWKNYPQWFTHLFAWGFKRRSREAFATQRKFIRDQIARHRTTFDPENLRDFLDVYLKDRPDIDEPTLTDTVMAFNIDSIHTLSLVVTWVIVYVIHRPNVQKRICEELDSVVGRSRKPSLDDRPNLAYLEATIMEVIRVGTILAIGPEHKPRASTTLRGYHIPKEAIVLPHFNAVHFDPTLFPEPRVFKPERFLDSDGKLVKTDAWMPFGAGTRMCMGEKLAKQEMLLIVANLFHRFNLKFADGEAGPPEECDINFFIAEVTYKVTAMER